MIIIDLIKELMYQQNKTIDDLVNGTGLSYDVVYGIVEIQTTPKPLEAKIILEVLDVSLEDVLRLY